VTEYDEVERHRPEFKSKAAGIAGQTTEEIFSNLRRHIDIQIKEAQQNQSIIKAKKITSRHHIKMVEIIDLNKILTTNKEERPIQRKKCKNSSRLCIKSNANQNTI
jgi:predicted RNase H-like HicB family nuclease